MIYLAFGLTFLNIGITGFIIVYVKQLSQDLDTFIDTQIKFTNDMMTELERYKVSRNIKFDLFNEWDNLPPRPS